MRKICLLATIFALSAFSGTLQAQVVNSIIRDTDPVSAGFAGASVALDATAFAVDNNPASMSLTSDRMAVGASYALLQPKSVKMGVISAAGFFRISDKLALGAGFKSLAYEAYPITSAEGRSTEEYKPSEIAMTLGVSYRIIEGLSAGINFKYASISLSPDAKSNVFSGDVSVLYRKGNLSAGLNARNLGSTMDFRAGGAYKIAGLTVSGQGEYSIKDMAFIRTGFHYGNATQGIPSYWSVGAGFQFAGIHLDVSYSVTSATIGNSLALGLSYSF